MAAYRFSDPRDLHAILDGIEVLIVESNWISAAPIAGRIRDEAHHQRSVAVNKSEWRDFLVHANNLELAVSAQDQAGAAEELAALCLTLATAAGPKRQP